MLRGFSITWCQIETEYYLELCSEGSQTPLENHPWPYGKGFRLGSTPIMVHGRKHCRSFSKLGGPSTTCGGAKSKISNETYPAGLSVLYLVQT